MEFIISATSPCGEELGSNVREQDPEKAILAWCRIGQEYPTCASIQADSEKSAFSLLKWADKNADKVRAYLDRYKSPYKPDYILDSVSGYVRNGKSSIQWDYDIVSPFSFG